MRAHIIASFISAALIATPMGQTLNAQIHGDAAATASFTQTLWEQARVDLSPSAKAKASVYAGDAAARAKASQQASKKGNHQAADAQAKAYEEDMIRAAMATNDQVLLSPALQAGASASATLKNNRKAEGAIQAGLRARMLSKASIDQASKIAGRAGTDTATVIGLRLQGQSWNTIQGELGLTASAASRINLGF